MSRERRRPHDHVERETATAQSCLSRKLGGVHQIFQHVGQAVPRQLEERAEGVARPDCTPPIGRAC
eukprot:1173866-Prorocentrum_minimum.AAC.1